MRLQVVTILPLFIATAVLSLSLPDSSPAGTHAFATIKSLQNGMPRLIRPLQLLSVLTLFRDRDSAQATFIVPSVDQYGQLEAIVCDDPSKDVVQKSVPDTSPQEFSFQVFASNTSCGSSNLTLNGVPLKEDWTSNGLHAEGTAKITPADRPFFWEANRDIDVWWNSDCLTLPNRTDSRDNDPQLLTLTIGKVGRRDINSLFGFTVSFTQTGEPQLLRLENYPVYSAVTPTKRPSWRDPPPSLSVRTTFEKSEFYTLQNQSDTVWDSATAANASLQELIEELRLLQAEAEALDELIRFKHDHIHTVFAKEAEHLKQEIHQCDGWICALKAIWRKVKGAAEIVYLGLRPNPHRDEVRNNNTYWRVTGGQQPTVMKMSFQQDPGRAQPFPQPPSLLHCADGQPSAPIDEKRPFPDELPPRPEPRSHPPFIVVLIKTILIITGLWTIFAFFRRRFCSLRSRTDRAARREQRRTERAYRRQACRQAFRDWWYGRRRGTPGRRPGDYEEKRALVLQQEGVLDEVMQDEIRQIQVEDEIRQLRQTHTTVEQLVRAEEGRSRQVLQHNLHQTVASSSSSSDHSHGFVEVPLSGPSHPHGFVPIPIPPRSTGDSSYVGLASPRSRTSSLPDYTSDSGISNPPPSYKSRASAASQEGEDTDEDVTSDYTPSTTSQWTPGSSIPDISPRPSIETARTFL